MIFAVKLKHFVTESSDIVITILSQLNDYNAGQAFRLKNNILKQTKSIKVSITCIIYWD